jgi:hypothetical protein
VGNGIKKHGLQQIPDEVEAIKKLYFLNSLK